LCCRLGHDARPHFSDLLKDVTIIGIINCCVKVIEDLLSDNTGGIRIHLQRFQNFGGCDSLLLFPPGIIVGCGGNESITSPT